MKLPENLPAAAERWLKHALPADAAVPSQIELKQEGSMEIRGKWTPFTAKGLYKGAPLSFNWKARLKMLPGVWIVAEDGYLNSDGWGAAKLWGFLPMGQRRGPEVLATQVIRNIGELAWLPEFALTTTELRWNAAGDEAFEIHSHAGEKEVMVRFEVDDQGDIFRASSPSRPYDTADGYEEAPWTYDFSDHRDFGGVRIPATAAAAYEKNDGTWDYFRGQVTSVVRLNSDG